MNEWLKISSLLCIYGVLRETRPSESYGLEFIVGEWRNLTLTEIYRDAIPITTYSYLAHLVIVFLVTDFLRYKPLIIVSGVAAIIHWCMLIWTKSLLELQILFVFYGTYTSTEIAYFTYIYAKVDRKHYPKVTSHTRAALLIGKLIASTTSQVLVYFRWMNYLQLNYITLATQIASTIWAFYLPRVTSTVYFHRQEKLSETETTVKTQNNGGNKDKDDVTVMTSSMDTIVSKITQGPVTSKMHPFELIWTHFKNAYRNTKVLQWSIWYSVILCGYLQVGSYIQTLWKAIEQNPTVAWNGAVDSVLTFFGAIFALLAGYLHAGRLKHRSNVLLVSILAICKGCALLLATLPESLMCAYVGYTIFGALHSFSITVTSAEVAGHLVEDSFGLVFGVNTFVALCLQTILTVIVVDGSALLLDIYGQFIVYGGYYIVIGIVFGCLALLQF